MCSERLSIARRVSISALRNKEDKSDRLYVFTQQSFQKYVHFKRSSIPMWIRNLMPLRKKKKRENDSASDAEKLRWINLLWSAEQRMRGF